MQAGRLPFRAVEAAACHRATLKRSATLPPSRIRTCGGSLASLLSAARTRSCRASRARAKAASASSRVGSCSSVAVRVVFAATVRPLVKKKSHGKRMPTGEGPPPFPAPNGGFRCGGKPRVPFDVAVTELLFAFQQRGMDRRGSRPAILIRRSLWMPSRRLKFRREAGDSGKPVGTLSSRSFPIRIGPFDFGAARSVVSLQKIPEIRRAQKSLPEGRGVRAVLADLGKGTLFQKNSLPPNLPIF